MWNFRNTNTSVFFRLFDSQVQAALCYSSEIWGLNRRDQIEKTHLFACKKFLGLDTRTPNHLVYGDLGRYPLQINTAIRAIKYWLKLCKMPLNRLPRQALEMIQNCDIPKDRNWTYLVKKTLSDLGFAYVWTNRGERNERSFLKILKQRAQNCFRQIWDVRNRENDTFT